VIWVYLGRLDVLGAFSREQVGFGIAVASLFGALTILTVCRENVRREGGRLRLRVGERDGFLLLAALLAVVYLVAPDAVAGGSVLQARLSLFPWLALIPWFSVGCGRAGRGVILALLTGATLWNVHVQVGWYQRMDREVQAFLAGLEPVPRHARILALPFDRNGGANRVSVFSHAIARAALDEKLLDWDNYEAATNHFPVRFRRTVERPSLHAFSADPALAEIVAWRDRADYIYAWRMPPGVPVADRLHRDYRLVAERGGGQLWASRSLSARGAAGR
jgi:hypothetical protein